MPKNKKTMPTDPDTVKAGRKKRASKVFNPEQSTAQPEQTSPSAADKENGFFIVGMGASAGGLEAFECFFSHMPPDKGMAFVIIQHILSDHKSIMVDVLKKYTHMKVFQIEDGMRRLTNKRHFKTTNR